jgi:hypothetical protein
MFGNPRPPTNSDMSVWLSSAWEYIPVALICNSFHRCFLGDSMFLHISHHDVYGERFRVRVAELSGTTEFPDGTDIAEDSDPEVIYDE